MSVQFGYQANPTREEALQPIFEQGDLRDPAQVDAVFAKYAQHEAGGIWAVIHLAALKAVGESGEKPVQYYQVNVAGSLNLLEVSPKHALNAPRVYGVAALHSPTDHR